MEKTKDIDFVVQCVRCGKEYHLQVNFDDYFEYQYDEKRRHVQDIFPYLKPWERELLISGVCDECWKEIERWENDED